MPFSSPLSLYTPPPPLYVFVSVCVSHCVYFSSSGESQIADHDMKEVYLSSVDLEGRVWASVVVGELPGFVEVSQPPSDQE